MIAPGKAEKKAARAARLSAALRENLKRRKAQTRGRAKSDDLKERPASEKAGVEAGFRTRSCSNKVPVRYYPDPDTDVRTGRPFGSGHLASAIWVCEFQNHRRKLATCRC